MKTMRLEIGDYSLNYQRRLRNLFYKSPWLSQALRFMVSYGAWILLFRFIYVSIVTYFNISPQSRFQDISDSIHNYSLSMSGTSAFLFIAFIAALRPMTQFDPNEFYQPRILEKQWLMGFIKGTTLSGLLSFFFILAGYYKFIGFYLHPTEAPLEFAQTLLRIFSIVILTYSEGYLFFVKLPGYLHSKLPVWMTALSVAFFYCITKYLQFDISPLYAVSLCSIALSLYSRTLISGHFYESAGFWAAILIIFNPLLSLPVFGSDHFGILILKPELTLARDISPHWITGGLRGPLCSPVFQLFLIFDFIRNMIRYKNKTLTGTM